MRYWLLFLAVLSCVTGCLHVPCMSPPTHSLAFLLPRNNTAHAQALTGLKDIFYDKLRARLITFAHRSQADYTLQIIVEKIDFDERTERYTTNGIRYWRTITAVLTALVRERKTQKIVWQKRLESKLTRFVPAQQSWYRYRFYDTLKFVYADIAAKVSVYLHQILT